MRLYLLDNNSGNVNSCQKEKALKLLHCYTYNPAWNIDKFLNIFI